MHIRPILSFLAIGALAPLSTASGQSTSDCDGAIPLCGGVYTESSAPLGTGAIYEFTGTCNASLETSSLWYTFTVAEAGNIRFTLDPADNADDYDWGLFNITDGGCAGINAQDGTSPEVNCNSFGEFGNNGATGISSSAGGTGISNGPGNTNGPAFNADLAVGPGQTYALVVMNWSNSPNGYTIDFTESTASIFDSTIPEVVDVTVDCENADFHLTFSEPMVTATVEVADFTITSPSGQTTGFNSVQPDLPGSYAQVGFNIGMASGLQEPGTYQLHITSVSENVEDACGNVVLDTTIQVEVGAPLEYAVVVTPACNAVNGVVRVEHLSGGVAPVAFSLEGDPLANGVATGLNLGSYTLTVSDAGGCEIVEEVAVPNHALNVQIQQQQDSISCATPTVTIAGVAVQPFQTVSYAWTAITATGTDPAFSTSATPEVSTPGNYVLLVTHLESGCTDQASVQILPTATPTVDLGSIILPNVVSPNADGKNDVWRPYALSDPDRDITGLFDEYELTIYNRWGQLLHSGSSSRSWSARDVADGSYFYRIIYRAECGTVIDEERTGTITVLR
ncbi:MAG: gliding motility-associated C-terminal domain-containing protein [Flavobacteriales bacterium]|nr:gliding motility-associated C-terminal domain-containing protein [Flavobacteriales bacterium]